MCGPVTHQVQFLQERTQIADIYILTLGESSKKKTIFYGQADRKRLPPPLPPLLRSPFCEFRFCVSFMLDYNSKSYFPPTTSIPNSSLLLMLLCHKTVI